MSIYPLTIYPQRIFSITDPEFLARDPYRTEEIDVLAVTYIQLLVETISGACRRKSLEEIEGLCQAYLERDARFPTGSARAFPISGQRRVGSSWGRGSKRNSLFEPVTSKMA